MKPFRFLAAALFTVSSLAAAQNAPFLGTWIYNADKSPKPTITYAIKDLGGERYALTGSSGETTEIKANGVTINSPSGAKVSFKKLDAHTWQMDRVDSRNMKRTYTVSSDDKTLQLVDIFTLANGGSEKTTTTYARTSPGKSIYGEWKSTSMQETASGPKDRIIIAAYGKDGLSLTSADKTKLDVQFDGKQYIEVEPGGKKGDSVSGKRVNDHLIQMDHQVGGKPESAEEMKISPDGKTLTLTSKAVKTGAVFISIWDKQ